MDEEWLERCLRVLSKLVEESGLPWFEALLASKDSPFPPRPAGFRRRQEYCNRCGQRTEMNHDYDALFCGRCNRWIDSKCLDPGCMFCSKRPERPVP
jgi:ribosomal protein S27AE